MQEPATTSQQIAAQARSQPVPDCKLFWTRLVADDSGQDLIEYALLAALIGLGSVLSMKGLSNKIANTFNSVGSTLTNDV